MIVIRRIFTTFLLTVVYNKVHGLSFITEQNKTRMALTGSNQTFTWKFSLTEQQQEKSKEVKVQFGRWNIINDHVDKHYLITFVRERSGNESVWKESVWKRNLEPITKRLNWVGNLARDYFVAFQLFNAQRHDSGNYGIRLRVDQSPDWQETLQSWFTLSVQDPPPLPTKAPGLSTSNAPIQDVCEEDPRKWRDSCPKWAEEGDCEDPNKQVFMEHYCPKTCNLPCPQTEPSPNPNTNASSPPAFCRDRDANCDTWKSLGMCEDPEQQLTMGTYCGVTCHICKEPTAEECFDKADNCEQLKEAGFCNSTVPTIEYKVKTNCLETCEFLCFLTFREAYHNN